MLQLGIRASKDKWNWKGLHITRIWKMLLVFLNNYYCLLKTVSCSKPMTGVEVGRDCHILRDFPLENFEFFHCKLFQQFNWSVSNWSFIKTASFNCCAPCRGCGALLTFLNSTSPALTQTQTSHRIEWKETIMQKENP